MPAWTYGKFVWRELSTTDVAGALRFYGELAGWKSQKVDMPNGPYHLLMRGEKQVAGLMAMDPGVDMPPYWMGYASVPDVDASVTEARKLGGQVVWGPTDVPEVGRMATIVDPQGAAMSLMRAAQGDPALDAQPGEGEFCWEELLARDPAASKTFYAGVLGWKVFPGPTPQYEMMGMGERPAEQAASITAAPTGETPAWRSFILVSSVEDARKRAVRLGGKILREETVVPTVGVFSTVADPQGAVVNLFQAAPRSS